MYCKDDQRSNEIIKERFVLVDHRVLTQCDALHQLVRDGPTKPPFDQLLSQVWIWLRYQWRSRQVVKKNISQKLSNGITRTICIWQVLGPVVCLWVLLLLLGLLDVVIPPVDVGEAQDDVVFIRKRQLSQDQLRNVLDDALEVPVQPFLIVGVVDDRQPAVGGRDQ